MRSMLPRMIVVVASLGLPTSVSLAGTLSAHYEIRYGLETVNFSTNLPGHSGPEPSYAAILDGDRLDLPPGPGVDTLTPDHFATTCVEIGEHINVPANQAHANVVHLLGATTTLGGISGPVFFDPMRTMNVEKLWGAFYSSATTKETAAAFQLCMWELAFDNDVTLFDPSGTSALYVAPAQFQAGITDVAENWLTQIRWDEMNQLPRTSMLLLTGTGIQDLVTPLPEPSVPIALLSLLPILRRRGC